MDFLKNPSAAVIFELYYPRPERYHVFVAEIYIYVAEVPFAVVVKLVPGSSDIIPLTTDAPFPLFVYDILAVVPNIIVNICPFVGVGGNTIVTLLRGTVCVSNRIEVVTFVLMVLFGVGFTV